VAGSAVLKYDMVSAKDVNTVDVRTEPTKAENIP
jgi:hypothetical protein